MEDKKRGISFGSKANILRIDINTGQNGYCSYCSRPRLDASDFKVVLNIGVNNAMVDDRWLCDACFKKIYLYFKDIYNYNFNRPVDWDELLGEPNGMRYKQEILGTWIENTTEFVPDTPPYICWNAPRKSRLQYSREVLFNGGPYLKTSQERPVIKYSKSAEAVKDNPQYSVAEKLATNPEDIQKFKEANPEKAFFLSDEECAIEIRRTEKGEAGKK